MWSYDEKGADPDGRWSQVYVHKTEEIDGKLVAKRQFRSTTGEKAPFWVTIGLWTRADGQCPVEPIVVHQVVKLNANFTEHLSPMTVVWCNKSGNKYVMHSIYYNTNPDNSVHCGFMDVMCYVYYTY